MLYTVKALLKYVKGEINAEGIKYRERLLDVFEVSFTLLFANFEFLGDISERVISFNYITLTVQNYISGIAVYVQLPCDFILRVL